MFCREHNWFVLNILCLFPGLSNRGSKKNQKRKLILSLLSIGPVGVSIQIAKGAVKGVINNRS